jgi:hypothetical protein
MDLFDLLRIPISPRGEVIAIKDRIFAGEQVVPGAPYQIRTSDLHDERVIVAVPGKGHPCPGDLKS